MISLWKLGQERLPRGGLPGGKPVSQSRRKQPSRGAFARNRPRMSEPQATSSLQLSSLVTCEPPSNTWHTVLIQQKHCKSTQEAPKVSDRDSDRHSCRRGYLYRAAKTDRC